ncbi:MAG: CotH kinase family protein [Ruminococcus sp.]|nr:CotH kinase family protein [Ruminococcus sp.]
MKKILSLLLAIIMILSAVFVSGITASAADGFAAGDVIYLQISNPANWAQNSTLYANFTEYSRADNDDTSIIIADADKSKYDPKTGVQTVENNTLYKYTVTSADAGKTVMRFWRGNQEKLWNSSVAVSYEDYAKGLNTAVVTDWEDAGFLNAKYDLDLKATLTLSKNKVEVGEAVDITLSLDTPVDGANLAYSIQDGTTELSKTATATFTPEANGAYSFYGIVTATDNNGKVLGIASAIASLTVGSFAFSAAQPNSLYAFAGAGDLNSESWIEVDGPHSGVYLFFMPSSVKDGDEITLYNTFPSAVTIENLIIPSMGIAKFKPQATKSYTASVGSSSASVKFKFSSAEAALFVNNPESFDGKDLMTYLTDSKENSAAATGAYSEHDGTIETQDIKKIKGRGNTSWNADKKGFNVTFKSAVSVAGMPKTKKFSLISNFQDAALARNRILYDMGDQVGVPYASDSRFIEFYVNGVYWGSYQMCQKIEVGKNALIEDVAEDDYLDPETGKTKTDYCFVAEIDPSPSQDDFHFSVDSGVNLTVKSPELTSEDPNIAYVRGYIKNKYNTMWNKLTANAADLNDYIDINSLAKVYLINELGKNWDSGAASFFLVYKPDENGKYKFFASPVWDYDNSLGNANGVENDLRHLGITDYTLPSGWFSTLKGGYSGPNFLAQSAKKSVVMNEVYRVWFEDFLPAIAKLNGSKDETAYLYSADIYHDYLSGSADMNYDIWELVTDTSWVADHSSLKKITANYTYNKYHQVTGVTVSTDKNATNYDQYTFDGQFDYMMDWLNSRAAWISSQYIDHYTPSEPPTEPETEAPTEPETEAPTEPPVDIDLNDAIAAWVFDSEGKTEGDKLTEYGNADDGYKATTGSGTFTLSVSGDKSRALEWSAPEYGVTGTATVPIMAAGSKNLWGSPYLLFEVDAKDYEDITFTAYLAGSNRCPASWQLSYSTDGATFTNVEGAVATITSANRKVLTAYLDKVALPAQAQGDKLYLKLTPTSTTTISGGDVSEKPSGGELALNYIVVRGKKSGAPEYKKGDVDLDGVVSVLDATMIQKKLASLLTLSELQMSLADTDGDGYVTVLDATRIQKWLASLIPIL